MERVLIAVHDEVYTFTPSNGGPEINIWSGRLRKWLTRTAPNTLTDLMFPPMTLGEMVERLGVEHARLASMTEDEAREPVIVGVWPGHGDMLIDGAHRVAFWATRGVNTLRGWPVPESMWRAFTFNPEDYPHALHGRDGSLLPHRYFKGDR